MFSKSLPVRRTLLLLIGVPVVWFAVWLLLSWLTQMAGIHVTSGTDITALLAIIGGIMGAIFTVGGLVIALVAVLTQIQLQDRVSQVLSQTRQALEDRFNNELIQKAEQQAQLQIEGSLAFFQATFAPDWKTAEHLTRGALEKYPKLQGARSFLGIRLAREVIDGFSARMQYSGFPDSASRAWNAYERLGGQPLGEAPKIEAIEWLNAALAHSDNPDGIVKFYLALVYGYSEAYDKMLATLRQTSTSRYEWRFSNPTQMAMLVYACRNERSRLETLGEALSYPLPATRDNVRTTVDAIVTGDGWQQLDYADWYAVRPADAAVSSDLFPSRIRIFKLTEPNGESKAYAWVVPHDAPPYSIPGDEQGRPSQSEQYVLVDALLDRLMVRFLFICPVPLPTY